MSATVASQLQGKPFHANKGHIPQTTKPKPSILPIKNPLGFNTEHGIRLPEWINRLPTPPEHTLTPNSSSRSFGQLGNEYVEEGRDKILPLECACFPINPRFTERFWHTSKLFVALADRQNNNLSTMFTGDIIFYCVYQKHNLFYPQFGFLGPTQMDVKNQTQKMNRTKMLHTIHNYLLVQHHFHLASPLMHINSSLTYVNKKIISRYHLNDCYIIDPSYCEGTLRSADPIKNFFLFIPIFAWTHRPIFMSIEYLQCVEEDATKCVYLLTHHQPPHERLDCGQASKSGAVSRGTTDPESLIGKATTVQCWSVSSGSRRLLRKGQKFIEPFRNPDNRSRSSSSSFVDDHSPTHMVSVPLKRRLKVLKTHELYFCVFFLYFLSDFSLSI